MTYLLMTVILTAKNTVGYAWEHDSVCVTYQKINKAIPNLN